MREAIRLQQTINCSPLQLWQACTTLAGISRWQADEVFGLVAKDGHLRLRWPALGAAIDLTVRELVEGEKLVLGNEIANVTMRFSKNQLTLTYAGAKTDDEYDGSKASWQLSLALLKHALERYPDKARHVVWAAMPMRISHQAAHVFFTEPNALKSWLCTETTGIPVEGPCELLTRFGQHWQGHVLCNVHERDALISCENVAASLGFRTLPLFREPGQRLVALCYSSWGSRPDPALKEHLEASLQRLEALFEKPFEA